MKLSRLRRQSALLLSVLAALTLSVTLVATAGAESAVPTVAQAAAASHLAQPPPLSITPTTGPPGTVVRFTGTGFTPGGRVSILLIRGLGLIVDEPTADAAGGVSGSLTMPEPGRVAELTFGPVDLFAIDMVSGRESPPTTFVLTTPAGQATIPTFTNLTPAPNSNVPAGPTVIAANITSDRAVGPVEVVLDGNRIDVEILGPSVERIAFFTEPALAAGPHTVKVTARDADGDASEVEWAFTSIQPGVKGVPEQLPRAGGWSRGLALSMLFGLGAALAAVGLRLRAR